MATGTLEQGSIEAIAPRKTGGPGWLDRLFGLPDRLPGPALGWYLVLAVVLVLGVHVPVWLTGARPAGDLDPQVVPGIFLLVYPLILIHTLRRVARSSFEEFRPALGGDTEQQPQLAFELTRIPDRQAAFAIVVAELVLNLAYFGEGGSFQFVDLPTALAITTLLLWWVVIAIGAVAVVYVVRQLRMVSRLHRMATKVDLFEPGPINAFSRLTATTAVGILIIALAFVMPDPEGPAISSFASGVGLILLAVASFVLPLRGMHERLSAEKDRLLAEAHARLRLTLERIHGMVDADDLARADQLEKTLTSLLAERDVLARLPTWPWSTGTFRGIASAVVLPIALWLVFRLLERVV